MLLTQMLQWYIFLILFSFNDVCDFFCFVFFPCMFLFFHALSVYSFIKSEIYSQRGFLRLVSAGEYRKTISLRQ